jgi:hypothetical protein
MIMIIQSGRPITSLKKVFEFTRRRVPVTYMCKILEILHRFLEVNDVTHTQRQPIKLVKLVSHFA